MYSIKPGRGPSLIGAIIALVVGVPFVLFWIGTAAKAGAPKFFVFFGLMFLLLLVLSIFMGFYNAASKHRISQYDITTPAEERDPFDQLAPPESKPPLKSQAAGARFCPACGAGLEKEFQFCPKCGAKQPGV